MPTFPADILALVDPVQDSDGTHTDVITIPASAPYTHQLGQGAPLNMPSGWQIIPPSGVPSIVTVSGGSHGTWTEVTNGSSLSAGQFSVDYSASATTGGTVYFAAADAGMTGVSVQYTGALEWNKAVVLQLFNAIRSVNSGVNAANGLAGLDANSHVMKTPLKGVRQVVVAQQTADTTGLTSTTFAAYSNLSAAITIEAGSSVLVWLAMTVYNNDAATQTLAMETFNAATLQFGGITIPAGARACLSRPAFHVNPGAGTYSYLLQYLATGGTGGFMCRPATQGGYERASLVLVEYA